MDPSRGASPAPKAQGAVERPLLDRAPGAGLGEHALGDTLRPTARAPRPGTRPDASEDGAALDRAQPPRHRRPPRLRRPPRRHPCPRCTKARAAQAVEHARQRNRTRPVVAQRYAAPSHDRHRARAVSAPIATHPERVHGGLPARLDCPAHLPGANAMADQPQRLPRRPTRLATSRATRRTSDVHRRGALRPGLDVHEGMNDDRCAPLLQDVSERDGRKAAKPGPPVTFFVQGRRPADTPPPDPASTPLARTRTNPCP